MDNLSGEQIEHIVWMIFRDAIRKHIETDNSPSGSEAEYRQRAEKAGLVAVVNFIGRAYRNGGQPDG